MPSKQINDPFEYFKGFKPLHGIIHYYVDLSCFLVLGSGSRNWWALNRRKRLSSLFALEMQYGNVLERDRVMGEGFDEAMQGSRTVLVERFGFYDLIVPLIRDGVVLGFLQAGAFAKGTPELGSLEKVWRELTGLEPSPALPEFRDFIRTMLEIPVLDGELMPALQEALELYAALLSGKAEAQSVEDRTRELLKKVFSKGLPHSYWMDWALGRPTSESTPPWDLRIEGSDWIRDEIGLTRAPTTVMVVMPRMASRGGAWAEERLRLAAYQRAAFRHAQTLPECVGGRLDDYGTVYVSSAKPGGSRLAQKQEIEAIACKIREFAQKQLGGEVLVSVGETAAPGESLRRSYLQAFMGLHRAEVSEKAGSSGPQQSLNELAQAFEKHDAAGIPLLQEAYLASVLRRSFHDPGEIRLHFQYAVGRIAAVLAKRSGLMAQEGRRLGESAAAELDAAANAQELISAFRDALGRLRNEPGSGRSLKRRLSMEELLARLNERPGEAQPLARLAAEAGLSVSTFSREFKRVTGNGFEAYLQQRRLDMARGLLRGSNLSLAQIARDCGFRSPSYFSRLFRNKCGLTADGFRKKARKPEAPALK